MKSKDQQLLEEAYESIFKQTNLITEATIAWDTIPVNKLLETTTPEVLEELFSGIKSMAQSAWNGVKNVGQAVANKATQTAGGIKAAAQQVGQNVKNIYNTGEQESAAKQKTERAAELVSQIQNVVSELIKANPVIGKEFEGKDPMSFTLGQIHSALQRGLESKQRSQRAASSKATQAKQTGIFGGVKQAFNTGSSSPSSPAPESGSSVASPALASA